VAARPCATSVALTKFKSEKHRLAGKLDNRITVA